MMDKVPLSIIMHVWIIYYAYVAYTIACLDVTAATCYRLVIFVNILTNLYFLWTVFYDFYFIGWGSSGQLFL